MAPPTEQTKKSPDQKVRECLPQWTGPEVIAYDGRALAFERSHRAAQYYRRRVLDEQVDVVPFAVKFHDFAVPSRAICSHTRLDKVLLLSSECMVAKLRTEDDVHGQVGKVTCTFKIKIPDTLAHRLSSLLPVVSSSVAHMLCTVTKPAVYVSGPKVDDANFRFIVRNR